MNDIYRRQVALLLVYYEEYVIGTGETGTRQKPAHGNPPQIQPNSENVTAKFGQNWRVYGTS